MSYAGYSNGVVYLSNFLFLAMAVIFLGGRVVSVKKILETFFLILTYVKNMVAALVGGRGSTDTFLKRDHPCKVWSKLALWFQRRRLKCKLEAQVSLFRSFDINSPLMNQLVHSDLISTMSTDAE